MQDIIISSEPISPPELLAAFTAANAGAGAIASFTGLVREDTGTEILSLSHYPGFTESQIKLIADQAMCRWPLLGYAIYHRVGDMAVGEPIVFVATASAHRRAAFEACDFLMDYLKSEAPFWKQEQSRGSAQWIEPKQSDLSDKKRWSA